MQAQQNVQHQIQYNSYDSITTYKIPNFYNSICNKSNFSNFKNPSFTSMLNNTYLVLHEQAYYSQLVLFDSTAKRINEFASQGKIKFAKLNDKVVAILASYLKYNGDYIDCLIFWNLQTDKRMETRYRAAGSDYYDDDDDVGIVDLLLITFQNSNIACLIQQHFERKTQKIYEVILNYYQYQENQTSLSCKHKLHYKYSQQEYQVNCIPMKLNNTSLIGFINMKYPLTLQKSNKQQVVGQSKYQRTKQSVSLQINCFEYTKDKNEAQQLTLKLVCQLDVQGCLSGLFLAQVWQIDKNQQTYYIALNTEISVLKQKVQNEIPCIIKSPHIFEYKWDRKNNKIRLTTQPISDSLSTAQFISNFHAKSIQNEARDKNINVVYLYDGYQMIGGKVQVKDTNLSFGNVWVDYGQNKICVYKIDKSQLTIQQLTFRELPFNCKEASVFFVNQIIEDCDDDLLLAVSSLLQ